MVKCDGFYPKAGFVNNNIIVDISGSQVLAPEPVPTAEHCPVQVAGFMNLVSGDREIVVVIFQQVPGVAVEFVFDLINKSGRPKESQVSFPAKIDAKQVIKTDEVVHVSMGDKNVR